MRLPAGNHCSARETKGLESGTRLVPSFWQPLAEDVVVADTDQSSAMFETEARCSRLQAITGTMFFLNDGAWHPLGQR